MYHDGSDQVIRAKVGKGIAYHPSLHNEAKYSITHISTGLLITDFISPERIVDVANRIERLTDWTQPIDQAIGAEVRMLQYGEPRTIQLLDHLAAICPERPPLPTECAKTINNAIELDDQEITEIVTYVRENYVEGTGSPIDWLNKLINQKLDKG